MVLIRFLVESGANLETVDSWGWTPLLYATSHGHTGTVRVLADAGASLDVMTRAGNTALGIAIERKHWEVVRFSKKIVLLCGGHSIPLGHHCCALSVSTRSSQFVMRGARLTKLGPWQIGFIIFQYIDLFAFSLRR